MQLGKLHLVVKIVTHFLQLHIDCMYYSKLFTEQVQHSQYVYSHPYY